MINDSHNLQERVQSLLRLGQENWIAVGKGWVVLPRLSEESCVLCHVELVHLSKITSLEHNDLISCDE